MVNLFLALALCLQATPGDSILHTWQTREKEGRILMYRDGKWTNGKIYNFNDGNFYDVTIELDGRVMSMRVYKGVWMFGKTLKWDLVE